MVLNESVDRDLDFAIVSRGDATSTKPLVVTVDAALAESHQGRLPAQTTVMLVLDAEGQPLLRYTHGLRHNQGNLPPEVKQF